DVVPFTEELKDQVMKFVSKMNEDGMRVLAIAQKNEVPEENIFSVEDESDMVLIGYIGFLDPPKETAEEAIKELHRNGVDVKVITGDNEYVAKKVCKDVGIPTDNIILGTDVARMSDRKLAIEVEKNNIFAKISPVQKARIVNALQENGHTVGYLGDGINDA